MALNNLNQLLNETFVVSNSFLKPPRCLNKHSVHRLLVYNSVVVAGQVVLSQECKPLQAVDFFLEVIDLLLVVQRVDGCKVFANRTFGKFGRTEDLVCLMAADLLEVSQVVHATDAVFKVFGTFGCASLVVVLSVFMLLNVLS